MDDWINKWIIETINGRTSDWIDEWMVELIESIYKLLNNWMIELNKLQRMIANKQI